ncbi:MAG: mutM [Paucimonas sp.]|nr:mutM [Paucimonas sp.]
MPELPEVEVTRRGVAPHVEGRLVTGVAVRHAGLRWPFPAGLQQDLAGHVLRSTGRRGKYLLLHFDHGSLIVHLGMSGSLRILPADAPAGRHDHFDLILGGQVLRLNDPRRFGAVLWHAAEEGSIENHLLLRSLGVEPFSEAFTASLLYKLTRKRSAAIKQVLLSGNVVVGVGNIYASESLFEAGINPNTPARRVGLARYERLVAAIRRILAASIEKGGSTLRDFVGADGRAGYFQQSYFVYDRAGEPCRRCGAAVRQARQGQRSTFYCVNCQK